MERIAIFFYWVTVIAVAIWAGFDWGLVAAIAMLPFVLGVMQRSKSRNEVAQEEHPNAEGTEGDSESYDDQEFPKRNWFAITGRLEDLTSESVPIRPLNDD